jgi:rare lipoprotein A
MKNVAPVVALILGAFSIVAYAAFWLAVLPAHAGEPACGRASWYGPGFHGKPTASGETYNQNALTVAHKTLPFGVRLRVTSQKTGKSVIVRVNDRGPFIAGRFLDLSKAAAAKLGMLSAGVATVCVERL